MATVVRLGGCAHGGSEETGSRKRPGRVEDYGQALSTGAPPLAVRACTGSQICCASHEGAWRGGVAARGVVGDFRWCRQSGRRLCEFTWRKAGEQRGENAECRRRSRAAGSEQQTARARGELSSLPPRLPDPGLFSDVHPCGASRASEAHDATVHMAYQKHNCHVDPSHLQQEGTLYIQWSQTLQA